jgi:cell wall-associated NlpC family hydrolase
MGGSSFVGRRARAPATGDWSRRLRLAGIPAALAVALTIGSASAAWADPPYPSAGEVQESKARAEQKAAEVGRIEAQLTKANATMQQLDIAAGRATEAYNGAVLKLQQAERAAADAHRVADAAHREVTLANERKGQLAAASYRVGGATSAYSVLISADGPQTMMDQAATLEYLGSQYKVVLDRAKAAALVADILDRQAAAALDAQRQAAETVRQAKVRAEAAVTAQQRLLAQAAAAQDRLLAELAIARSTSIVLERARAEGLAEEAARRAAEGRAQDPAAFSPGGYSYGTTAGAARAIEYARRQLGRPYAWGASGPFSFDCSGLTMMAWRAAGVYLPHYSVAQYQQVKHITLADLRGGDLLFWSADPYDPDTIYHVALYVGGGLMIQAPRTGDVVKISSMYAMGVPDFYGRP